MRASTVVCFLLVVQAGCVFSQVKRKELIVALMYEFETAKDNAIFLQSAEKLQDSMKAKFDVSLVKMGAGKHNEKPPNKDPSINSIDDLPNFIKNNIKQKLDSIHFVGHGAPGTLWLPGKGQRTHVQASGAGDTAKIRNWSFQEFADFLKPLLNDDAIIYLEQCFTGQDQDSKGDSPAQQLANAGGWIVWGHTTVVEHSNVKKPTPKPGGKFVPHHPQAEIGYEGGVEITSRGRQTGMQYLWYVNSNGITGICDIHIELPKGVDPKKFKNFKVLNGKGEAVAGWSGGTSTATGKTYLSWYADKCDAKSKLTGQFSVSADYMDPNASKDEIPKKKFDAKLTNDGSKAPKKKDTNVLPGGAGTTEMPKFNIALGDVDRDGRLSWQDVAAIGDVLSDGGDCSCHPDYAACCEVNQTTSNLTLQVYEAFADVNCDGTVDVKDGRALLQAVRMGQALPLRCNGDALAEAAVQDTMRRMEEIQFAYADAMRRETLFFLRTGLVGTPDTTPVAGEDTAWPLPPGFPPPPPPPPPVGGLTNLTFPELMDNLASFGQSVVDVMHEAQVLELATLAHDWELSAVEALNSRMSAAMREQRRRLDLLLNETLAVSLACPPAPSPALPSPLPPTRRDSPRVDHGAPAAAADSQGAAGGDALCATAALTVACGVVVVLLLGAVLAWRRQRGTEGEQRSSVDSWRRRRAALENKESTNVWMEKKLALSPAPPPPPPPAAAAGRQISLQVPLAPLPSPRSVDQQLDPDPTEVGSSLAHAVAVV